MVHIPSREIELLAAGPQMRQMEGSYCEKATQNEFVGEAHLAHRHLPYGPLNGIGTYCVARGCCIVMQEPRRDEVSILYGFLAGNTSK
jgi:hypothetical protein